ncbi:MAG: D-glycero-beta-D-manno-heptose 1-phosphate adenylyltransferase [Candidatus Omnitrophota bacterium]
MIKDKIKSLKQLSTIVLHLRHAKKKIAFTNGCFDLIHYGHIHYLEQAKKKTDFLIVAINSDSSVKKIKGPSRPITSQKNRARVIAALECVDYVTVFNQSTPQKLIEKLKPDILIKGADWKKADIVGSETVIKNGGKIVRIKLIKKLSTTQLIKNIVKKKVK